MSVPIRTPHLDDETTDAGETLALLQSAPTPCVHCGRDVREGEREEDEHNACRRTAAEMDREDFAADHRRD